jgi:hypothetical protein
MKTNPSQPPEKPTQAPPSAKKRQTRRAKNQTQISITLDKPLLEIIDAMVARRRSNRSQIIREIVADVMQAPPIDIAAEPTDPLGYRATSPAPSAHVVITGPNASPDAPPSAATAS